MIVCGVSVDLRVSKAMVSPFHFPAVSAAEVVLKGTAAKMDTKRDVATKKNRVFVFLFFIF